MQEYLNEKYSNDNNDDNNNNNNNNYYYYNFSRSSMRLNDSASVFVSHSLESWISHPKESEMHLTASLLRYPNRKASI